MTAPEEPKKRRGRPPLSEIDKRVESKVTLPPIVHARATKLAEKRGKSLSELTEIALKKLVEAEFWGDAESLFETDAEPLITPVSTKKARLTIDNKKRLRKL